MQTKNIPPSLVQTFGDQKLNTFDRWTNAIFKTVQNGKPIDPTQSISAAEGIKINSDYKDITLRVNSSTGANVNITANPQISYGEDNQHITLEGTDDTATVTLATGNGLKMAAGANFILKKHAVIVFYFNKQDQLWIEKSRSTNT